MFCFSGRFYLVCVSVVISFSASVFVFCEELAESNVNEEDYVWEAIPLITGGGFEPSEKEGDISSILAKWKCSPDISDNKVRLDSENCLTGKNSLCIEGKGTVYIRTEFIPIPKGMVSVTGSASYRGMFPSHVMIQWIKESQPITTNEFKLVETSNSEWKRFVLPETRPPSESTALLLQISTDLNPSGTVWWDEVNLTAIIEQTKTVDILVNQVGYDILCPKAFIVATNFVPNDIETYLLNDSNNEVQKITLADPSRIIGINKSDWGKWFYRGDFTDFNEEGQYKICAIINKKRYLSSPFMIGKDLLWEKTIPKVLEGIRMHRCGTVIEGVHDLCHAEDSWEGKSLVGGWHNGEDFGKQKTALCLNHLAESYILCKWRLLKDKTLEQSFREELEWGAKYILNRVKEDGSFIGNVVVKGGERIIEPPSDEDICVSALAYLSYGLTSPSQTTPYTEYTERVIKNMLDKGIKTPGLFTALVYMGEIKGYEGILPQIKNSFPTDILKVSEVIPLYDGFSYEHKTYDLVQTLNSALQNYIEQANQNPFGICPMKWGIEFDYFGITSDKEQSLKGNNTYLLQIAQLAGKAFRFIPDESKKKLFFDQINWILGVNPFGVCFIEGLGEKNLRSILHAYTKTGVATEKLVGFIPYGIRAFSHNSDVPYLNFGNVNDSDIYSAGVSMETMAQYINAMAHYYRVRVHAETNPPVPLTTPK